MKTRLQHPAVLFFLYKKSISKPLLSRVSSLMINPVVSFNPDELNDICSQQDIGVFVLDINWFRSGDFSLLDIFFGKPSLFRPLILVITYKDTPSVLMNRAYMYGVMDFIKWPQDLRFFPKKLDALLNMHQDRHDLREDLFHQHFVDDEILDARRELENLL